MSRAFQIALLLLWSTASFAQVRTATFTLSRPINSSYEISISLNSVDGISPSTQVQEYFLFIKHPTHDSFEIMQVMAVNRALKMVTVMRDIAGFSSEWPSGSVMIFGPSGSLNSRGQTTGVFVSGMRAIPCRPEYNQFLPVVDIRSGKVYDCTIPSKETWSER